MKRNNILVIVISLLAGSGIGFGAAYSTINIDYQSPDNSFNTNTVNNIQNFPEEAQEMINSINAQAQDTINSLNSEIASLQGQLSSAETNAQNLQTQLDSANSQIGGLQSQVSDLQNELRLSVITVSGNVETNIGTVPNNVNFGDRNTAKVSSGKYAIDIQNNEVYNIVVDHTFGTCIPSQSPLNLQSSDTNYRLDLQC